MFGAPCWRNGAIAVGATKKGKTLLSFYIFNYFFIALTTFTYF